MIHFLLNNKNIEGFNDDSISFYNLEIDGSIIKLYKQTSDLCFLSDLEIRQFIHRQGEPSECPDPQEPIESTDPGSAYIFYSSIPDVRDLIDGGVYFLFEMKQWEPSDNIEGGFYNSVAYRSNSVIYLNSLIPGLSVDLDLSRDQGTYSDDVQNLMEYLKNNYKLHVLAKYFNRSITETYLSFDNLQTFFKVMPGLSNREISPLKITDPSASIFKNPFILLTRILGKNPEGDETTDYIGCKNYECKTDKKPLVSRNYDPTNLNYLTCNNSLDFSPNKPLGTPCDDSICCFNTRCSGEDVCDLHGDNCSDAITSKTLKEDASCMSIENCTNNFPLYCIAQTPSDESQTEFDSIDTDNNGTLEYSELSGNYPNAELNKILGLRENTDTNTFVPLTRQEFDEFFRE